MHALCQQGLFVHTKPGHVWPHSQAKVQRSVWSVSSSSLPKHEAHCNSGTCSHCYGGNRWTTDSIHNLAPHTHAKHKHTHAKHTHTHTHTHPHTSTHTHT